MMEEPHTERSESLMYDFEGQCAFGEQMLRDLLINMDF